MLLAQADTLRAASTVAQSVSGGTVAAGVGLGLLALGAGAYYWLRRTGAPRQPPAGATTPARTVLPPAPATGKPAPNLTVPLAPPPAVPAAQSASTPAPLPPRPVPPPVSPPAAPPTVRPASSRPPAPRRPPATRPARPTTPPAAPRPAPARPATEPEQIPGEVKYIGYTPIPVRAADRYPLVRMPAAGRPVPIKFPRAGRVGQRGYCEAAFVEHLRRYFPKSGPVRVFDDRHLPGREGTRPYEPDVALLHERGGLNLFLDIEVDEPYDGGYRTPTHYQGADLARDLFFTRRGWVVLRFAEIQVHQHPLACCAVVAQLLARLDPTYQVPAELQHLAPPPAVPAWSLLQAQQWAAACYREQYLGIEQFGRYAEGEAAPLLTEALPVEAEVEKLVEQATPPPPLPRPGPLQRASPDPRRKILRFEADQHQYTIHGRPATAVSTLVKEFFPEYDTPYWSARKAYERGCTAEEVAAEWAAKAQASSAAGTALHQLIEDFYNGREPTSASPEFAHFLAFHRQHAHLVPYRTEWQVFHEELMLAGTIDFVARHADGSLSLYDWKRSHRVVTAAGQVQLNAYQPAEGPLNDLPDCSFSHYTLQQNVYKWLLEAKYGCRVRDMHLVVLHPDYDRFHLVPVPERPAHVAHMLAAVHNRR